MLTGIDHVVMCVADVETSLRWYVEMFELEPVRLQEWRAGKVPFVSLRVTEDFVIDLVQTEPNGVNVDHIALVCDRSFFDGFVAEHAALIEMGPRLLFGARGQGQGVYLRDPDGHRVELRTY